MSKLRLKLKRPLAMLVAVLLVLSLMPVTVFAVDVSSLNLTFGTEYDFTAGNFNSGTKMSALPVDITDSGNANITYSSVEWGGASGADKDSTANTVYTSGDTPTLTFKATIATDDTFIGDLATANGVTVASVVNGLPQIMGVAPTSVMGTVGTAGTDITVVATYSALVQDRNVGYFYVSGFSAPAFGVYAPNAGDACLLTGGTEDQIKMQVKSVSGGATAGALYAASSTDIEIVLTATALDGYYFESNTWSGTGGLLVPMDAKSVAVSNRAIDGTSIDITVVYPGLQATDITSLSPALDAPVVGEALDTTVDADNRSVTYSINWTAGTTGGAQAGETPKATITATAKPGYVFADTFAIDSIRDYSLNGGVISNLDVTNIAADPNVVKFDVTYPKLVGKIAEIDANDAGLDTAPAKDDDVSTGATPGATTEITFGQIAWTGVATPAAVAIGDTPVATLTATANAGYAFDPTVWQTGAVAAGDLATLFPSLPTGATVAITAVTALSQDGDANTVTFAVTYPKVTELITGFALDVDAPDTTLVDTAPDTDGANGDSTPAGGADFSIAWTDDETGDAITEFAPGQTPVATVTVTPKSDAWSFNTSSFAVGASTGISGNVNGGTVVATSVAADELVYTITYPMLVQDIQDGEIELTMLEPAIGSPAPTLSGNIEALTYDVDFGATATGTDGVFAVGDEPVATITITAPDGYTFNGGIAAIANLVTSDIAGSYTPSAFSYASDEISFTLSYDMLTQEITGLAPELDEPVLGETAPTTLTATDEATYSISWTGLAGTDYASGDTPVATIVATAETGYTFNATTWATATGTDLVSFPGAISVDLTYTDSTHVSLEVTYPTLIGIDTAEIAANPTDEIVVTLESAVAGLDATNFEVWNNGSKMTVSSATTSDDTEYTLTLSAETAYGDEITVTVTEDAYIFNGGEAFTVDNSAVMPKSLEEIVLSDPGFSTVPDSEDPSAPALLVGDNIKAVQTGKQNTATTVANLASALLPVDLIGTYDVEVYAAGDDITTGTALTTEILMTGQQVQLVDAGGNPVGDPIIVVVAGDTNGNGLAELGDLLKMFNTYTQVGAPLTGAYHQAGLMNPGAEIDVGDLLQVFQLYTV